MFRILFFLLFLFTLGSCGLKYVPVESPSAFEQRRHDTIERYLSRTFHSSTNNYKSIAFGETQTIKPLSYQKLDSLFGVKYANEKKGVNDKELDNVIQNQRMIALNDTNKVIYIENHIFALVQGDTLEIYDGNFRLSNDLVVEDMHLNESVYLPKKFEEMYKVYLFEEAFITAGIPPTEAEKQFYNLYKSESKQRKGSDRDNFIKNTLLVMDYASKSHTLDVETLIKYAILKNLHGNSYVNHLDKFSPIEQLIEIDNQQKQSLVGYTLTCTYIDKDEAGVQVSKSVKFVFDTFLQLTEKIVLN
jgi:predicted small lipoprotein YifL